MGVKPRAIQWATPAEASLEGILIWIEAENPETARRLWARAMAAIEQAARFPVMNPALAEGGKAYREILSVRPFRIVYRIETRSPKIVAVLRQEQDFDPGRFLME